MQKKEKYLGEKIGDLAFTGSKYCAVATTLNTFGRGINILSSSNADIKQIAIENVVMGGITIGLFTISVLSYLTTAMCIRKKNKIAQKREQDSKKNMASVEPIN